MDATEITLIRPSRSAREAARELPPELVDDMILPTVEAAKFCGYSADQWRNLVAESEAPQPIKLSTRRNGWRVRDLKAWIRSKETAS